MLSPDSTGMRGEELCQFPRVAHELWVPMPAAAWAPQSGALCLFESLLCLQCPTKLGSQWLLKVNGWANWSLSGLSLHIRHLLVEDSEQFLIVFLCSDVREVKSVCTQSPVSPQCSFQYQRFVSNVSIFSMKSMSFFLYL